MGWTHAQAWGSPSLRSALVKHALFTFGEMMGPGYDVIVVVIESDGLPHAARGSSPSYACFDGRSYRGQFKFVVRYDWVYIIVVENDGLPRASRGSSPSYAC